MVCCVQMMWLMEFLIEHHGELFGKEVTGLAGASAKELPVLGQKQTWWGCFAGTSKVIHQPAALHKYRVRLMQVGRCTLCSY